MENQGSLKAYTIGFVFSIILTIIPLLLVLNHVLAKNILLASILGMPVLQFFVQLLNFDT